MMERHGLGDFKYFVGIGSLGQIASRSDRVCVLNILGGESSLVTPVSHAPARQPIIDASTNVALDKCCPGN
jgi:hypothetical protein